MLKMRCNWAESGMYPGMAKFHPQASEAEQMSSRSARLTALSKNMDLPEINCHDLNMD